LTSKVTARAIINPTPKRIRYPIPSERIDANDEAEEYSLFKI
jgi:hypothetical protein